MSDEKLLTERQVKEWSFELALACSGSLLAKFHCIQAALERDRAMLDELLAAGMIPPVGADNYAHHFNRWAEARDKARALREAERE